MSASKQSVVIVIPERLGSTGLPGKPLIEGMLVFSAVQVGTLCHSWPAHEAANPNTVRPVVGAKGEVLYFSRSPKTFARNADAATYLKDVGVYAYRREVLQAYGGMPKPMLENAEKLEQLRLLVAGIRIKAFHQEPTGSRCGRPRVFGAGATSHFGLVRSGKRLLISKDKH